MKLIILDRDGVINEDSDSFIKTPDEWIALPGSLEAIARLTKAGYKVVVATNPVRPWPRLFRHHDLERHPPEDAGCRQGGRWNDRSHFFLSSYRERQL